MLINRLLNLYRKYKISKQKEIDFLREKALFDELELKISNFAFIRNNGKGILMPVEINNKEKFYEVKVKNNPPQLDFTDEMYQIIQGYVGSCLSEVFYGHYGIIYSNSPIRESSDTFIFYFKSNEDERLEINDY